MSCMLCHVCEDIQKTVYMKSVDTSLFYNISKSANANEFQ